MTAITPLEQALVAWRRPKDPHDRRAQIHVDDAVALAETDVFSVRNIVAITDLPQTFAYELLHKHNKIGGRLNPETLPLIYDIWLERARGPGDPKAWVRTVLKLGTSQLMLAKLTGIPQASISEWANEEGDQ
jgi:hypothetical protein